MSLENIVDGFKKYVNIGLASLALIAGGASYTNTAYAAGDNSTPAVTTTQQTEIYKGIEYTAITNEKGETIYVPTIATPQNIMRIIEEYKKIIQHNINVELDIEGKKPIEKLTIEPNLEEKLTIYLFLAAKNNGNATPKTLEELKQLEEKLNYPIIMTYGNFKTETKNGKTYLVPIKIEKPEGYLAGIKTEKPKKGTVCDAEYVIKIRKSPEGKKTVEINTKENRLSYTKRRDMFVRKKGVEYLVGTAYDIFKPTKPTEEETWIHGCVIKNPNTPKKATLYFSAPFVREYKQWNYANNN